MEGKWGLNRVDSFIWSFTFQSFSIDSQLWSESMQQKIPEANISRFKLCAVSSRVMKAHAVPPGM